MATSKFANNWKHLKQQLQSFYPHLKDADLDYVEGREDELLTRLQKCLGKSPFEMAWLMEALAEEASRLAGGRLVLLTGARWNHFPVQARNTPHYATV